MRALLMGAIGLALACGNATKKPEEHDEAAELKTTSPAATKGSELQSAATDDTPSTTPTPKKLTPKKLTPKTTRSFGQALSQGRKLGKQARHAEAISFFEAALVHAPGDAKVLSELSWSAFQTGEFAKSIEAARESIANTSNPDLQASSLYNLGRALEELGKKQQALASYQESHELRPHRVVRERIEKLGGKVETTATQVATLTEGPYKSIDEYCQQFAHLTEKDDLVGGWDKVTCRTGKEARVYGSIHRVEDKGSFQVVTPLLARGNDTDCTMAFETSTGWYISSADWFNCFSSRVDSLVLSVDFGDFVPGGDSEVVIVFRESSWNRDWVKGWYSAGYTHREYLVACGIGASGKPSCTGEFPIGYGSYLYPEHFDGEEGAKPTPKPPKQDSWFLLEWSFDRSGVLHIAKGKRHYRDGDPIDADAKTKKWTGSFEIRFP